ncbi:MAG: LacI family transcriptional regulator [Lachnospiraceae bacterium]|jgi:LacI family transcriptional regulator/LacI family repressor for deo operon, udp, cdd, tsx, nupC, and nupG|nr:LacI family transcriptional regulator [Lachnospiraceae bacterium]MCH4032017.1 LacI family transcriptional regulator [Lachnospiraceae bacterium]MCH4109308.1 LacI family transcriptional regulator [Lachnospiraceae bacterium]
MKVTRKKLAEIAGVSQATVSRYFNSASSLNIDTRAKIRKAIEETDADAGSVSENEPKKIIMILLSHMHFPFYQKAVDELLSTDNAKYTFIVYSFADNSFDNLKNFICLVRPAGVVYFEEELDNYVLQYLRGKGIRTVMFGGIAPTGVTDMVHVNDILATYDGTKYLLELGHRNILFLSDNVSKIGAGFQRLSGCRQALSEAGIEMTDSLVSCGPVTFERGYQAALEKLTSGVPFTAVFAFSDELAIGAMAALQDEGKKIPEDISVLGFDDLEIAKKVRPALTTIHQPIKSFVQKVIEIIDQPLTDEKMEILLPYQIIKRGSCSKAKT